MQAGGLWRLAEFRDVGAGEEGAAGAGDYHGFDGGVIAYLTHGLVQSGADLVLQRIDRRIIGGDDRDFTVATELDAGIDAAHDAPAPDLFQADYPGEAAQ
jgi:hypothetical protein